MEEAKEILENNRIEDISWLCSLSESELVSSFAITAYFSLFQ